MENLTISAREDLKTEATVIEIDAKNTATLRDFYTEIAKELHFPDYFGFNLDSLDEMLNDLSWIEDETLIIYFKHSENFLVNERNESKIITLLDILDATCEDWKWMEQDASISEDDEDFVPKKALSFVFSESQYITEILNKLK